MLQNFLFRKHLEQGEEILYAVHKHWVAILKPLLLTAFFGVIVPWSLYAIGFNSTLFFWIATTWSVIATFIFMYDYFDWYADAFLITNMGVLSVEWNGFFHNASTRIGYETIEGLTYEIKGFWATIFRYGSITLNIVSGNNLILDQAKAPKQAELMLARYQEEVLAARNIQDASGLKALLTDLVGHHMRQNTK